MLESLSDKTVQPIQAWKTDMKANMIMNMMSAFKVYFLHFHHNYKNNEKKTRKESKEDKPRKRYMTLQSIVLGWVLISPSKPELSDFFCPPRH